MCGAHPEGALPAPKHSTFNNLTRKRDFSLKIGKESHDEGHLEDFEKFSSVSSDVIGHLNGGNCNTLKDHEIPM